MFGPLSLGLKLLGIGKWLKDALGRLLSAIMAHPKEAALIALALACVWLWRGWNAEQDAHALTKQDHKLELDRRDAASQANLAAALAQVKLVEAKSAQLAKDADHAHELALQDARSATDRYIAANRVRPRAGGSCPAAAATEGNDPGVPAGLPADTGMVAVRETELQAFVDWVTFGVAAHNHAVGKINAGTAKVPEGFPKPELSATPN